MNSVDDITTVETKRYAELQYGIRNLVVWVGPFCPDESAFLDVAGGVMWRGRTALVSMWVIPRLSDWFAVVDTLLAD